MESTKLCDDNKDAECNYTCRSDVSWPRPFLAVTYNYTRVFLT